MQRDRVAIGVMLESELLRVEHAQRQIAGLELGVAALGHVRRLAQAERLAVELRSGLEVAARPPGKADAADELVGAALVHRSSCRTGRLGSRFLSAMVAAASRVPAR